MMPKKPIGHEYMSAGYRIRKVSDTGNCSKDWKFVHHLVWLEAGREIPAGHVFFFKDGNPKNTALENLAVVSKSEHGKLVGLKKRHLPFNIKPIGTETLRHGYLVRKIQDTGNYAKDWCPVHRLVWLEAGREIPAGHVFFFKDGNPKNTALENLAVVSRSEHAKLIYLNNAYLQSKKMPIGAKSIRHDYLMRKIQDTGNYVKDWRPAHHLVWLEAGREIPPGYRLCFKDGDRTNINLENLELLTVSENMKKWLRILPISFRVMVQYVKKLGKMIEHMKDQEQGEV